ncbi:MAG: CDP-glycerol glycerophosphotransferase family protein [Corynebacterium sp.]|nr:CDP-glycerol glycerophosphotransferase family protein [Corynebacterium sp.]
MGAFELDIVVPCALNLEFLSQLLETLANSAKGPIRVILIDDGVGPNAASLQCIVEDIAIPNLIVESYGKGPGAARNLGLEHVDSKYVYFCDADDLVLPGALDLMVATLERTGSDFVVGGYVRHYGEEPERKYPRSLSRAVHAEERLQVNASSFPQAFDEPVLWNKMFRTDFWRSCVGKMPEDVNYEDQVPVVRALVHARAFDVLAEDVYSWRMSKPGTSRSGTKDQIGDLRDRRRVVEMCWEEAQAGPLELRRHMLYRWVDTDLMMYVEELPNAVDVDYFAELQSLVKLVFGWIDTLEAGDIWEQVSLYTRMMLWVVAHGTLEQAFAGLAATGEVSPVIPLDMPLESYVPECADLFEAAPPWVTAVNTVDIQPVVKLEGATWLDDKTVEVAGYGYVPGKTSAELRVAINGVPSQAGPSSVSSVSSDPSKSSVPSVSSLRSIPSVSSVESAAANYSSKDTLHDYSHTGFRAVVRLADLQGRAPGGEAGASQLAASITVTMDGVSVEPESRLQSFGPVGETGRYVLEGTTVRWLSHTGTELLAATWGPDGKGARTLGRRILQLTVRGGRREKAELKIGRLRLPAVSSHGAGEERTVTFVVPPPVRGMVHGRSRQLIALIGGKPVMAPSSSSSPSPEVRTHTDGTARIVDAARRIVVEDIRQDGDIVFASISAERSLFGAKTPAVWITSSQGNFAGEMVSEEAHAHTARFTVRWDTTFIPETAYHIRWEVRGVPTGHCLGKDVVRIKHRPSYSAWETASAVRAEPGPVKPAVYFEAFNGESTGDNPGAIVSYLVSSGVLSGLSCTDDSPGVPLYMGIKHPSQEVPDGVTPVLIGSPEWVMALRESAVLVGNDSFPHWFRKRPGQSWLQTWHGTPIKKLMLDAHPRFVSLTYKRVILREAQEWDLLLAQSSSAAANIAGSVGYTGPVHVGEYPQNLRLAQLTSSSESRVSIRERLGIGPSERVVLYAPTWRVSQQTSLVENAVEIAKQTGAVVLYRGHHKRPRVNLAALPGPSGSRSASEGSVIDVTHYPVLEELMAVSDALISDYSSVVYAYALTGKPITLYCPDLSWYRDYERGFYDGFPENSPWPVYENLDGLTTAVVFGSDSRDRISVDGSGGSLENTVTATLDYVTEWILSRVASIENG